MPASEKSLRNMITGKLRKRLENIWIIGEESYHEAQKGDNIQGYFHCKAVEDNLGKLISDEKKRSLKELRLFLLSASACLHDIGKVVEDNHKGWKSDHGKRSAEIICKEYAKLGLKKAEAIAVSYIVSVHGDGRLNELPKTPFAVGCEQVNLIELAAPFRLGDMMDTCCQRAPEILSDIIFPDGNVPSKWRGRQAITGWYLDKENRIVLQAVPETDEDLEAAYVSHRMMKEDLAKVSAHLMVYGYPWEIGDLDVKSGVYLEPKLEKQGAVQKPLPGMGFYTRDYAKIFKGRDAETRSLLSIISNWPISLLIGESGSGKTSLIHAGVFPKAESMGWTCVWTRPFDKPQDNIKETVWQTLFHGKVDPQKSLFEALKTATEKCKPHKLLIAMDQFEDLLHCRDQKVLDDFCKDLMAIQTRTIFPNLKVLIAFREDASVRLNNLLLKRVTGSAQQFPSLELERLDREGATEAMLAGLENAGIGLDATCEISQKPLIDVILDDLQKSDDRFYPPFIQIVAEALCKRALDCKPPVVTWKMYFEELKTADNIIGNYLANQLEEFGAEKEKAEKFLVALTSSAAMKIKKSLSQLSLETGVSLHETRKVIAKMIDLRMVRPLSGDEFELIHDYLSKIVDEQLVKEEVRTIKFLQEQLDAAQQAYNMNKTVINSPVFMASLYRNRRKIIISEDKNALLLGSSLLTEGVSCWYFLKNLETKKIHELLRELARYPLSRVRERSVRILGEIAEFGDVQFFTNMLQDEDSTVRDAAADALASVAQLQNPELIVNLLEHKDAHIRQVAIEALPTIAQPRNREIIVRLLQHEDYGVRQAAAQVLPKIAQPQDKELVIELLQDSDNWVRQGAAEAFEKIAQPQDKELIIKLLHHNSNYVRQAAAQVLPKIAQPQDKELLVKLIQDKNEDDLVHRAAIVAYENIYQSQHTKLRQQQSQDYTVRVALAEAQSKNDIEIIVRRLQLEDYGVRGAAAEALTNIAQHQDIELIIKLLHHNSDYIRRVAAQVLPKIAQPQDKELLVKLMQFYNARQAAARALTNIVKPQDTELILNLLLQYDEVKLTIAEVLANSEKAEEREALLDSLSDKAQGWSKDHLRCLTLLSELDQIFYSAVNHVIL